MFRYGPGSSQWTEEATLQPSTSVVSDFFGSVLCLEVETIVAGEPASWYPPPDGLAA